MYPQGRLRPPTSFHTDHGHVDSVGFSPPREITLSSAVNMWSAKGDCNACSTFSKETVNRFPFILQLFTLSSHNIELLGVLLCA